MSVRVIEHEQPEAGELVIAKRKAEWCMFLSGLPVESGTLLDLRLGDDWTAARVTLVAPGRGEKPHVSLLVGEHYAPKMAHVARPSDVFRWPHVAARDAKRQAQVQRLAAFLVQRFPDRVEGTLDNAVETAIKLLDEAAR